MLRMMYSSLYPERYFAHQFSALLKLIFLILLLSFISAPSFATNGYLLHGYGKNKGLGGSGVANPQDALAGATNPAGAVWVGDRIDITGELFAPSRGYEISDPGGLVLENGTATGDVSAGQMYGYAGLLQDVDSDKNLFMIPAMGIVKQLPHGNAVGLSVYGAGLGTEFNKDDTPKSLGTFFDGSTGVDLLLMMANLHFASKITDDISVGVGIVGAAQSFKAKGLTAFQGLTGGKISNNERDWAFGGGFNVGIQANLADNFSVAASYYSKIKLTHDKYTGLFADEGDFSLAPIINVGMTYRPSRTSAINFDVQVIQWSEIPATGNKLDNFINQDFNFDDPLGPDNIPLNLLGEADGAGFGFDDSIVYKVGYQFKVDSLPKYTWRVGYSYQDQIIPENGTLFPILAPATIQHHYTAGLTRDLGEDMEINMNVLYAPKETVKGEGISDGVDIYLEEYGLELGLGYKY